MVSEYFTLQAYKETADKGDKVKLLTFERCYIYM